jgi:drug/metabolite transporter (DMT)-like permease
MKEMNTDINHLCLSVFICGKKTVMQTAIEKNESAAGASTTVLVIALLAIDGLHYVFARALHDYLPPITAAMFVLLVATVEVGAYAIATKQFHIDTFRRHAPFFLGIAALIAFSTSINYTAVGFIDPGTAALLSQMSVLFGLGFGLLWLKERLTKPQLAGAALCVAGVAIITFQPGDYFRTGAVMLLFGSFAYALHAAIVKRNGGGIPFIEFFFWRLACTAGFLFLASTFGGTLAWPSPPAWLILLLAGTVDVVISRSLYYLSMRRLKISVLTLVLTLSPAVTALWSFILFSVRPSLQQVIGGAAVMAGVLIVTSQRRRA